MPKRRIDWYYHRRNCEACEKADRALVGYDIAERVDARKTRFDRAAALTLARSMRRVVATRGAKTETFDMRDSVDADLLAKVIIGPSGNLRAPSMRIGDTLFVGLAPELAAPAPEAPRGRKSAPAGYSGTPLARKLGIKPGSQVYVVNAPAPYSQLVAPLPEGVRFAGSVDDGTDLIHLFCTRRADLERRVRTLLPKMRPDAAIWASWPKKASGVATDLTEDAIREVALPLGLVDVKVCAVDPVWSGLKLVVRIANRPPGAGKRGLRKA